MSGTIEFSMKFPKRNIQNQKFHIFGQYLVFTNNPSIHWHMLCDLHNQTQLLAVDFAD